MSRSARLVLLGCILGVLALGCASTHQPVRFQSTPMSPDGWVAKVDEFVIIADASQSMSEFADRAVKLPVERELLVSMNRTLPELAYHDGLRVFGRGSCLPKGRTNLIEGMGTYSTAELGGAIARLKCTGGRSPLDLALKATATDLHVTGARKAVVVVSDGMNMNEREVSAAAALKQKFGNDLCIYTIHIGNERIGASLLKRVADAGGCGFATSAVALAGSAEMARFVEEAFVERDSDGDGVADRLDTCPDTPQGVSVEANGCPPDADGDGVPDYLDTCPDTPQGVAVEANGCPPDADGDGVPDYLDTCPDTPQGVAVEANGCPPDTDGDGVPDYLDTCPDTPRGMTVDAYGCPIDSDGDGVPDSLDKCPNTPRGVSIDASGCLLAGITVGGAEWTVQGKVLFDLNKANIKKEAEAVLGAVADFLKENAQYKLEIQGHTDATGTLGWNMKLSQMRADSVKAFLVDHGAGADRLTTKGLGPNEPVASNDTVAGRRLNRRVDFKPSE
jgi:outer membrane protein OmpA-like peptidoglycan-associated protein